MIRKSVYTKAPIEKVSSIALDIFNAWVKFARGEGTTPFGYKLKGTHGMTGRYAASLSFHVYGRVEFISEATRRSGKQGRMTTRTMAGYSRSPEFNQVVFQADEKLAIEAAVLEYGRKKFSLKKEMLKHNFKWTKAPGDKYKYRIIPIKSSDALKMAPLLSKEMAHIGTSKKSFSTKLKQQTNLMKRRADESKSDVVFRTMSDRPGSKKWEIPAEMPHNIIGQFAEQLRRKLAGRF